MSNTEKVEDNPLVEHKSEESESLTDKMEDNENKTMEEGKEKELQEVSKPMGDPENYIKHPLQNR